MVFLQSRKYTQPGLHNVKKQNINALLLCENTLLQRSDLTVIDGGGRPAPELLNFPALVQARSPFNRAKVVNFRVSRADATKAALVYNYQPAFQFWCGVMAKPPPIPFGLREGSERQEDFSRLIDSIACFQGVSRPLGDADLGEHHLIYVLKPRLYCRHEVGPRPASRAVEVGGHLVFTVHVRLDVPYDKTDSEPSGTLTHWQFFEADPTYSNLPVEWNERYIERHW